MPPVAHPLRHSVTALMLDFLHHHVSSARARAAYLRRAHPDAYFVAVTSVALVTSIVLGVSIWLAYVVLHDLPGAAQLRDISAMAQATTLYDRGTSRRSRSSRSGASRRRCRTSRPTWCGRSSRSRISASTITAASI